MKFHTTAIVSALALAVAVAQTPMHMSFSNTSASTVLKVIASRTGVNIVFVGKESPTVSMDVTVDSAEKAVKAVSSAAGLSYRKVQGAYIVAAPDAMRQALMPYTTKVRYLMAPGVASAISKTVQDSFPDATVQVIGDRLVFTGIPDDVAESRTMILDLQRKETERTPVNEIIPVVHASPADVAKIASGLYPELKISSAGNEKGGAVTISGPVQEVEAAVDFVKKLDGMVQTAPDSTVRIYEIKYSSAGKLQEFLKDAAKDVEVFVGPESYTPQRAPFSPLTSAISASGTGSSGGNQGLGGGLGNNNTASGVGGQSGGISGIGGVSMQEEKDSHSKRLVLRGLPARVDEAMRLLDQVDLKPQQVFVEVRVVETSPSLQDDRGFNWNWSPINFFEAPPGANVKAFDTATRPLYAGQFSRQPVSFGTILNAQIKSGEAKMLANPKVEVVDNGGASVFIGDTIRAKVAQAGTLGAQTIQIEEFPVGIILLIHPRINANGDITMHVNPVVSSVTGVSADNVPQTSSREAETTVIVKDGETMVLGGLIQDSMTKTVTAVPFLSQLPLVGELFKNRSTTKKRTDLIITITPHIVKDTPTKSEDK